jgi:hypothetical protein
LSRRGRSVPANASGVDTHRASISSRFDCRHTEAEREGFHVPPEWEKRIAAIMSMGCGREMAIGALRQCNGHGGKARRIASEKLHVGKPADLHNAVVSHTTRPAQLTHNPPRPTDTQPAPLRAQAERLSEEDMRYRMRAHFLGEVQRLDQVMNIGYLLMRRARH